MAPCTRAKAGEDGNKMAGLVASTKNNPALKRILARRSHSVGPIGESKLLADTKEVKGVQLRHSLPPSQFAQDESARAGIPAQSLLVVCPGLLRLVRSLDSVHSLADLLNASLCDAVGPRPAAIPWVPSG